MTVNDTKQNITLNISFPALQVLPFSKETEKTFAYVDL